MEGGREGGGEASDVAKPHVNKKNTYVTMLGCVS